MSSLSSSLARGGETMTWLFNPRPSPLIINPHPSALLYHHHHSLVVSLRRAYLSPFAVKGRLSGEGKSHSPLFDLLPGTQYARHLLPRVRPPRMPESGKSADRYHKLSGFLRQIYHAAFALFHCSSWCSVRLYRLSSACSSTSLFLCLFVFSPLGKPPWGSKQHVFVNTLSFWFLPGSRLHTRVSFSLVSLPRSCFISMLLCCSVFNAGEGCEPCLCKRCMHLEWERETRNITPVFSFTPKLAWLGLFFLDPTSVDDLLVPLWHSSRMLMTHAYIHIPLLRRAVQHSVLC